MNLPRVQKDLAKARSDLEKLEGQWEVAKNHTGDNVYASPVHEVNARTKDYMDDHKNVAYSTAMGRVMVPETAYVMIQKLKN